MSVQLGAPADELVAGDVEAELSALDALEAGTDSPLTFPTALSSMPICCTLADF
ncbi:hypothetical protein [Amycolatopsis sp. CA-230715]|uniref:hypothetical protein n=1 Tax=Amycolatopsis sp. CA-230715 TaxID=2745196 RepID=UPI001C0266DC|nr:hypothetical protein [Amycolatopsis sp. CA-230715]QWF78920.1 hypothetical protein HUW46_02319 [Amycolatopsis sp. CA-230715]